MNLDDLQKQWNDSSSQSKTPLVSVNFTKPTNNAVSIIQKNMRNEFWIQLFCFAFIGFLAHYLRLSNETQAFFYIVYPVMLTIAGYYLYKFSKFYQSTLVMDYNMKDNLQKLYYELKLHIEMYKAYNYNLSIFLFPLLGMLIIQDLFTNPLKSIYDYLSTHTIGFQEILLTIAALVTITLLTELIIRQWVQMYYGKYLSQIEKTIKDLEE